MALIDIVDGHAVLDKLADDYAPLSDMRASAQYRMDVSKGLLFKALIEAKESTKGHEAPDMRVIAKRAASNLGAVL